MTDTPLDTVRDVDPEILEQAQASLEQAEKKVKNDPNGPRVKGGGQRAERLTPSDTPFPEMDLDQYGPQAFGTNIKGLKRTGFTSTQEFYVDAAKLEFLPVAKPGQNLPKKRLYVVKALHKDGTLVQLPQETRHNNNASGDPGDMIGLRRYQRKGLLLLMNFETGIPWYCAAWDCWAQAVADKSWAGFCTSRHAQHTLPNRFKESGEILQGLMSTGITTSQIWGI